MSTPNFMCITAVAVCCYYQAESYIDLMQHFYVYLKKNTYFSKLYYHTSLHDPVSIGTSV
jgi:hypothetical protein